MPAEKSRLASPCRRRNVLTLVCCSLLMSALTGCGTSEYERRLSEREGKVRAQIAAKFNVLNAPQELGGTGVSIGIPRVFANPPLVEGQVDARRAKPSVFTLPVQPLTHEAFVQDSEGGQIPYYLYVGVVPGTLPNIANLIQTELSAKAGGKIVAPWADFKGETANGQGNTWRRLRFEVEQDFYYKDKAGQDHFSPMPGTLELYLFDAGTQVVIVAWSMPTSIEPASELANLAPLVAGSVNVKK